MLLYLFYSVRRIFVKKFDESFVFQKVGLQEFELPKNVLEIVYTQTICWIGGFFCPLIHGITALKLFVFFYAKKVELSLKYYYRSLITCFSKFLKLYFV